MAERAEQALRQNGHFLTFEDPQGVMQRSTSSQSKKAGKAGGKEKGGC